MLRILSIAVLVLAIVCPAHAATRYVDADCSNGISTYNETTQACTGGTSTVYSSIANGIAAASSGDVLSLGDDTYTVGNLTLGTGISLTSTAADKTKVIIQPSANDSVNPFVRLDSETPGTNGNQTISLYNY
jgi:hypothetical protein